MMDFKEYLKSCSCAYKTVTVSGDILKASGFKQLDMKESWSLKRGQGYFVYVYETCIAAFVAGKDYSSGDSFRVIAAHTDQPCFRIKPNPIIREGSYLKLDVEVYGGAILNTWLDRPLSISGSVSLLKDGEVILRTIDFRRPMLTIPNLAIHLNRDVNKGVELNKQTELEPIIGLVRDNFEQADIKKLLADELNLEYEKENYQPDDIASFDLCVYNCDAPTDIGLDGVFLSSPRIDNLSSCYAAITGIAESSVADDSLSVTVLFDNEETGSVSKQGADSQVLPIVMRKIYKGLGYDVADIDEACFKSLMISADVAHAYHPNYGGKYDPQNKCMLGEGIVLKLNYTQRYATDAKALGELVKICSENDISYQQFVNRSDIAGGSTLGAMLSATLPVRCVDLGCGILAMHSACELMAKDDEDSLCRLFKCFFS